MNFAAPGAQAGAGRRCTTSGEESRKSGVVRLCPFNTAAKNNAPRNVSAPKLTAVCRGSITGTARRSLPVSSFAAGIWCETARGGSYSDSLYFSPHANTHNPRTASPRPKTRSAGRWLRKEVGCGIVTVL